MGACMSSGGGPAAPAYSFDFDAEPSTAETEIWTQFTEVLAKGPTYLRTMTEYKGCDAVIRAALSDPTPENEEEAMKAVERAAEQLYHFYEYARELEAIFPTLLTSLCLSHPDIPLSQRSATVQLLAKVFHFAFHFDELKMVTPAIQNDFSYYRRVLSRLRTSSNANGKGKGSKKKSPVSEDVANQMSFHFAYPTPVMKVLISAAVQMTQASQLVPVLAEIANVAGQRAAQVPGEENKLLLCLMTGCIIVIDHVSPAGAFHKKSPVRLRQCIHVLQNSPGTDSLCNSLRFSTLHLADDTTQSAVTKALSPRTG